MTRYLASVLDDLCRTAGVRGAVLVSAEDGLVVAEAAMEGLEVEPVAALAASLAARLGQAARALEQAEPSLILLDATDGSLLIARGQGDLLLVAVTAPDANTGLVRLALLDAAGRLA
jgi:predicted regulator of Ras-like GTPase activity (Roadblock/LC7/MglB family)